MLVIEQLLVPIDFHCISYPTVEVNGDQKQNIFFCVQHKRNFYRFGTTWGWVNDDNILIWGWTVSLSYLWMLSEYSKYKKCCFLLYEPKHYGENIKGMFNLNDKT